MVDGDWRLEHGRHPGDNLVRKPKHMPRAERMTDATLSYGGVRSCVWCRWLCSRRCYRVWAGCCHRRTTYPTRPFARMLTAPPFHAPRGVSNATMLSYRGCYRVAISVRRVGLLDGFTCGVISHAAGFRALEFSTNFQSVLEHGGPITICAPGSSGRAVQVFCFLLG